MEKENKQRLIDVNAVIRKIQKARKKIIEKYGSADGADIVIEAIVEFLKKTPSVDAVEVVRCKECEFSYEGLVNLMCGRCGQKKGNLRLGGVSVTEDHFCGYGKRREKA